MFKDMTLGQYYPAESVIHRLDPRTKLLTTLLYLISLFIAESALSYLAAFLYIASLIALSKVSVRYMFRGLKGILFLLLFSVVLNIFLTPGRELVSFWGLKITEEELGKETDGFADEIGRLQKELKELNEELGVA